MRQRLLILAGAATCLSVFVDIKRLAQVLNSDYIFSKWDFIQFFLMGKALSSGAYLYSPLPELARNFDPRLQNWLQHSAGYPPIVAVLGLPFSKLPYSWAAFAWLSFESLCFATSLVLILKHFGGRHASTPVIVTALLFIGWQPVFADLLRGQIMMTILLLLTVAWLALRSNRDSVGGIALGLALALKLYAWPIMLFLCLTRRFRAVCVCAGVFCGLNALMALWLGPSIITDYYLSVIPKLGAIWHYDVFNFSAWGMGHRTFGVWAGPLCAVSVLLYSLTSALRARDFDWAYMIMLTASTILSPVSWIHYFVTLLPAMCLIASDRLRPRSIVVAAMVFVVLLPGYVGEGSAFWGTVPFVGLLGFLWLLSSEGTTELPKPAPQLFRRALTDSTA